MIETNLVKQLASQEVGRKIIRTSLGQKKEKKHTVKRLEISGIQTNFTENKCSAQPSEAYTQKVK